MMKGEKFMSALDALEEFLNQQLHILKNRTCFNLFIRRINPSDTDDLGLPGHNGGILICKKALFGLLQRTMVSIQIGTPIRLYYFSQDPILSAILNETLEVYCDKNNTSLEIYG